MIKLKGEVVFGGYTKAGWEKERTFGYTEDPYAFVFSLESVTKNCVFISSVKQDEESVSHALGYDNFNYGMFGHRWIFSIASYDGTLNIQDHYRWGIYSNYEPFKHGKERLYHYEERSSYNRDEFEFEVFQIDNDPAK